MQSQHYPFSLPALPYAYDALEPLIDAETLHYHHDKHFQTYVDNLNKALAPHSEYHDWTLATLIGHLSELPDDIRTAVRNNGGGVFNHDLYFKQMTPEETPISGSLLKAVEEQFESVEDFLKKLKDTGLAQFGSGYVWLVEDTQGKLQIIALPNQDNPLTQGQYPLLCGDVWEHAYYLKYKNMRADYLDAWIRAINWNMVQKSFHGCG